MDIVKPDELNLPKLEPGFRKYRIVKTIDARGGFYHKSEYLSQNEWLPISHEIFSTKQKCIDDLDREIEQYLKYRVVRVEYEDYSIESHINDFNNNKGEIKC